MRESNPQGWVGREYPFRVGSYSKPWVLKEEQDDARVKRSGLPQGPHNMNILLHILLIFSSLLGLWLAFFIWRKKQLGHNMVCPLNSDCNAVIYSKHSKFFGIPVEIIGLGYYGIISIAYLFFLITPFDANSLVVFLVLTFSTLALLFSLYLTFIQIFSLKQWCVWCLMSAGLCVVIFTLAILGSGFGFVPLLIQYYGIFVIFHVLGVSLGLGSVIIVDIFFYKFLEDSSISKWEADIMHVLSQVIWCALAILVITGLCFYIANWQELNQSPKFLVKMIAVLVIIVNGALLNLLVTPNLMKIPFDKKDTNKTGGAHYLRKLAFALGAISMTSWLSAFLLGMLRGLQVEFLSLLSVYIGVVIIAVISSQFMEWYYANRT